MANLDQPSTTGNLSVGGNLSVTGTSTWTGAVTTTGALTVGTDIAITNVGHVFFVRKTADESVTSSTTLQNDDHLVSDTLAANAKYIVECGMIYTSASATPGIKNGFTGPASATMIWGTGNGGAAFDIASNDSWNTTAGGTFIVVNHGLLQTSGSTGTLTMQWAQLVSNGTAVTVKTGSWLYLRRVV